MDCLNISSSRSSDSSEGCLNVETSNNLIDVPFEENEGSVMDCDEGDAGSVTLNFVDIEDFLEGNEEEEATSISISSLLDSVSDTGALNVDMQDVLEGNEEEEATSISISSLLDSVSDTGALNVDMQDVLEGNEEEEATSISISSLLDSVSATGAEEVIVDEADDEAMVDVDQVSISQSDVVTPSELSAIEGADAQFEADAAVQEHINLLEAAELKRNSEQVFPQAPVSEASTDTSIQLTPLQEYNFKITIDAIRLREERREAEEIQAFLDEQELSVTQCTGYGIRQGHLVFNRVIEGLLPKIPSMQLTFNWLTNSENNFNISI